MKKQYILASGAILVVALLFFFGKTTEPKKPLGEKSIAPAKIFNITQFIDSIKLTLTPDQNLYVSQLENGISRGDVKEQQIKAYQGLANFWKDSIKMFEPYAFYTAESSKLENSEKNLTFAAQLFLANLRREHDEAKLNWQTNEAIGLFEKALALNPEDDELKIGLGSAYVFGKGKSGDPQQTMKGIQELLSVVRKDSNNMRAQLILGIGGSISGQYDKAIERLLKVAIAQPNNLEAIIFLADTYAAKGEKTEAVKWYEISKKLANDPAYTKEVDNRIKML